VSKFLSNDAEFEMFEPRLNTKAKVAVTQLMHNCFHWDETGKWERTRYDELHPIASG
jgi:hypothetical protein